MKKYLIFFLAFLFLLTACGETVSEISEELSAESTDESTDESTEENTEKRFTLVSRGKPYTKSVTPPANYPDKYDQQLTDGHKVGNEGAHYVDSRMVGFTASSSFVIDLGEDGKRITAVVARSLDYSGDGVALAATARFAGSEDGTKFKTLGTRVFVKTGDLTVSEARFELRAPTDYRYIRVQIIMGSGAFFFTDEIEVYADVDPKEVADTSNLAYQSESIDRNAWQSLSTKVSATPVDGKTISVGSKYTIGNAEFDKRAPQNDKFLTDNTRTGQYFGDNVWVGFKAKDDKNPTLTVNLDKAHSNVYMFNVYALGIGNDIELPAYIDVYAAKGNDYTFVGRMYNTGKEKHNYTYSLLLPEYIDVKNVRFEFPKSDKYYWIEEIEIVAGYNEEQSDVIFEPLNFPEVTEDILWDASEPDYKKTQNLLLGLPQQVQALFYADADTHGDESRADNPCLTDGKKATTTAEMYCYSSSWFFSRGGDGIEIFYDLGKLSTLESAKISYLEQDEWGIRRPKFVSVFLSDDGKNWYEVADWARGDDSKNTYYKGATHMELEFKFDKAYAARFIYFRVENSFIFIDELEAFGTKQVKSSTTRLADSGLRAVPYYTNQESEEFATTENTPIKAKDIALVYGDRSKAENLLPLVAYLDEDGNIKDTLMDGFIYCSHYNLPSGSQAHLINYMKDWEYVLNHTFNGQAGFDKLDETVAQVKAALNIPDYKVKVYVTYLTLRDDNPNFGDVDGDGISENTAIPEDRKKIVDWYIDETMRRFNEKGYENLEFDGFYWVNESVVWEKDDSQIITEVADATHAKGHNFLWIPYYKANRFFTGYELGFDIVCMQPNVVFTTDAPLWRFDSTAAMTKARKMCVEIEHSYQAFADPAFARTYMLYLLYGATTGYIDAIHIYYDDVDNFSKMAVSDSELCRMQYDATYNFIKGNLDITPDKRDEVKLTAKKDTAIGYDLNEADALQNFTLLTAPKHGYIAFDADGTFRYYPDKGYTGTDSFTYTYNEFLGESEPCTVQITVE